MIDESDADGVVLVCNPLEGVALVEAMAARPADQRVPILSHWGITGANFAELAQESLAHVDLSMLQTHSFLRPRFPERSARLYDAYAARFPDCESPRDVFSPVGTAHAYDLVHLLAVAVENAGTLERKKVRDAMEGKFVYQGVLKNYENPFSPSHHDALDAKDFILAEFADDGAIQPIRDE